MNLEYYKNFVEIADAGTISAASEKLMIAQPALTKQIKLLEDDYGATLFIRKPRKIELTDAGRILYDRIKDITRLEDAARKEINSCVSGTGGILRLGTSPANPDPFFYRILLDFHEKYEDVSFEIYERNSNYIKEQLSAGLIEVGLIRAQSAELLPPDIRPVLSINEYFLGCFHKDHKVLSPSMDEIPLTMLRGLPVSISSGLLDTFNKACEKEGFMPNYVNVSASRSTSRLFAEDQKTVSIMAGSVNLDDSDLCMRKIDMGDLYVERMFIINRHRRMSAVAENFLQFCRVHPLMTAWIEGKSALGVLDRSTV